MTTGNDDRNQGYPYWGDGLKSLHEGFVAMSMPEHRHVEALNVVGEVLRANTAAVDDFRWYKLDSKNELVCYWVGQPTNVLWVTTIKVHIDLEKVTQPDEPATWDKKDGRYVGWKLPGA